MSAINTLLPIDRLWFHYTQNRSSLAPWVKNRQFNQWPSPFLIHLMGLCCYRYHIYQRNDRLNLFPFVLKWSQRPFNSIYTGPLNRTFNWSPRRAHKSKISSKPFVVKKDWKRIRSETTTNSEKLNYLQLKTNWADDQFAGHLPIGVQIPKRKLILTTATKWKIEIAWMVDRQGYKKEEKDEEEEKKSQKTWKIMINAKQ